MKKNKSYLKLKSFMAACEGVKFTEIIENGEYYEATVIGFGTSVMGLFNMMNQFKYELDNGPLRGIMVTVNSKDNLQAWIEKES